MAKRPERRYSDTPRFEAPAWDRGAFRRLMPRRVGTLSSFVEHVLEPGDRLDSLAERYFGDPRLWWAIAQANPGGLFPADLVYRPHAEGEVPDPALGHVPVRAGLRIRIPERPETPT